MGVTAEAKDRVIAGQRIILTPYTVHHVNKYHEWMKDPELLFLTGSEPLTLDQEYEMQQKWIKDEDKCTFILLDRETFDATGDEVAAMIGDTNVYFPDPSDLTVGEIELMIADRNFRGKGLGKEVLKLMVTFCHNVIGVKRLFAKIKMSNEASIRLFTSCGFELVSESDVFQEKTFELDITKVPQVDTNTN